MSFAITVFLSHATTITSTFLLIMIHLLQDHLPWINLIGSYQKRLIDEWYERNIICEMYVYAVSVLIGFSCSSGYPF